MLEVANVQAIGKVSQPYAPKQLLKGLKTFEDLSDVVFYVPFVYNLVKDRLRTDSITDLFSHSLMNVLGDHPLIITDLPRAVFETKPPLLLTSDQKSLERTIYAAPKSVWESVGASLHMVTAVDKATRRFCIFRMYKEEIPCPLGQHADRTIPVWFCNLYGNKETYYFTKGLNETGGDVMQLYYAPPIKEFVDLGEKMLGLLQISKSNESAYGAFSEALEATPDHLLAVQKNSKLQDALATKPLEESQLTSKQRADCYELIRMYYQIYGEST